MQITNIIHLIWLGDILPDYTEYVISAYQEMNPSFEIRLTHRTISQLEKIYRGEYTQKDDDIINLAIQRTLKIEDDEFIKLQLRLYGDNVRFVQVLSDVLRLELLNRYGGIYVDLDTFPVKAFDQELLSNMFFVIKRFNGNGFFYDNYFMGKQLDNKKLINPYNFCGIYGLKTINHYPSNYKTSKFLINQNKFFKKQLKIGDYSFVKDFYIDHYFDGRWRYSPKYGIRVDKIFLDYIWKK